MPSGQLIQNEYKPKALMTPALRSIRVDINVDRIFTDKKADKKKNNEGTRGILNMTFIVNYHTSQPASSRTHVSSFCDESISDPPTT
jgi:hypothetical protein